MTAYQVTQQFQAVAASAPPSFDPVTGAPVPTAVPPEIQQAQMLMQDAQQGMARRTQVEKIGKTLEALFAYSMTEQQPVDFKTAMKQLVRRACTTGVGYVEVSFERENGAAPEIVGRLEDAKARLAHLQKLMEDAAEGEVDGYSAEAFELEKMIESLMAQPEIVLREGLVFDFPASTKVIPDQMCKSLIGFQGARTSRSNTSSLKTRWKSISVSTSAAASRPTTTTTRRAPRSWWMTGPHRPRTCRARAIWFASTSITTSRRASSIMSRMAITSSCVSQQNRTFSSRGFGRCSR